MAAVSFLYSRTNGALAFLKYVRSQNASCGIELRTTDEALGMVGGADHTASGYWTTLRLDRFVPGQCCRVAGGTLSRTQQWEIDAFSVNFPR